MNRNKAACWSFLAFICVVAALFPSKLFAQPGFGQPSPDFKVTTTSGQPVSLENYRGYVLVVDFFATWCPPCRIAIPHLVEMNRKYGKQGLQVLGLSIGDEDGRTIKKFAVEKQINYPVAVSGETVQTDFGIRSIPVMVVIDKKGKVAEVFRGYSDEVGRSVETLIRKLLAEK